MNILAHERGQVYLFAPREFGLECKRIRHDVHFQIRETGDALHANPHGDPPGRKEPSFAHAHIQRIRQWGDGHGTGILQVQAAGIFFSLEVEGFPLRNLADMNFHFFAAVPGMIRSVP